MKYLLLAIPLLFLASGQQLTSEISDRFIQNAPRLAHVHLIPFLFGEGDICQSTFDPNNDLYSPEAEEIIEITGQGQRVIEFDDTELDICRVEFFLEFEANVNFTDLGVGDTDFFLCTELFDFFQSNGTDSDPININSVLEDQICEFCLEGDVDDTPFAILVVPQIQERDIIENFYTVPLEVRLLQDTFDFESQKLIRLKEQSEILEIVETEDFNVVGGQAINNTHVVVEYNQDIHFVQFGQRTTDSFTTDCSLILQQFNTADKCTFSISENLLLIDVGEGVPQGFIDSFLFFIEEPPIYAIEDRFGLKRSIDNSVFVSDFVELLSIAQLSVSSFALEFSEPMLEQNVSRVLCSDVVDFVDTDIGTPYFPLRTDLFCSIQWANSTTAFLNFIENVPVIFTALRPSFNQAGPITRANGFGVPFIVNQVVVEAFGLEVTATVSTLTALTQCDTEIFIDVQISGNPVLVALEFSVNNVVGETIGEIEVPSTFCQVLGSAVRCDLTLVESLLEGETSSVDFNFDITVQAVGRADDPTTNVILETISVPTITQSFDEISIPINIPGVDFTQSEEPTVITRGVTSFFTAVVGDIFNCVNADISALALSWEVSELVTDEITAFVPVFTQTGRSLTIAGNALTPDVEHQVTFTATLAALEISSSVVFSLAVEPAAVVLVPEFGNEQTVSDQDETLILSAQRSCNPNLDEDGSCQTGIGFVNTQVLEETNVEDLAAVTGLDQFDLEWSCLNCGNQSEAVFDGTDRTQPVVEIPLTNFDGLDLQAENLRFSFTATNPQLDDVSSIEVAVQVLVTPEDCVFPAVTIAPVDARINANSAVALQGAINPTVDATFQWEESVVNAISTVFDVNDAALTRLALFIPANTLSEGATYTFRLSVTPDCAGEGDIVPSAVTSFQVNRRPFGGVLNVAPTVGDSFTSFVLTTSSWQDTEGDLPLQFAFELIYLAEDEALPAEFSAAETTPLSQFSTSPTLVTNLQVPAEGTRTVLIAVAKDSFGAVSRRAAANGFDGVVVDNPFVNDGVIDANAINVTEIQLLIQNLQDVGDASLIPNLCSAITSALNELSDADLVVVEAEVGLGVLEEVRAECFNAVSQVVLEDPNVALDVDVVNLVASSLSTITEQFDQLDDEVLENVDTITSQLVSDMQGQVDALLRGDQDPAAASIIPESFKQSILDTVSNILSASDNLFGTGAASDATETVSRRRLQALDPCVVLGGARTNVVNLTSLETSVVTNGAPAINAEANTVSFTATRENINDVGVLSNLLVVPDSEGGDNEIELPAALAEQLRTLGGQDVDLNVLAAKWKVNIRCEVRPVEEVTCNRNYTYDGPRDGAEGNIVSLDFFPFDGSGDNITVEDIAEPIVIFLDLPVEISADEALSSTLDECQEELDLENGDNEIRRLEVEPVFDDVVCGFFDEANGDFITNFCNFVGFEVRNGVTKVRCECFHATDYAAWNAFRYDVRATLVPQLVLSDLAKLILLVICPIILLLLAILLLWANYRDKKDAKNILKGALARIKLMRILKKRQKRQFFDRIKIAQVETIMNVHDAKFNEHSSIRNRNAGVNRRKYLCRQFYLAVKYEHSLFGLSRYDPNFSRVQRVWIFIAVFISSFGSAALLFELRSNVYEISVFVTVAVSFGAAFMVSIPVKVVARALFKTTENKANSHEDQVNSLYKIITRLELADGTETETDKALVDALHDYHIAESTMKKQGFKGSTIRRPRALAALVEESEDDNVARVVEGSGEDELEVAQIVEGFIKAKDSLNDASKSARNAWKEAKSQNLQSGTYYSSWPKIKSLRSSSSGVLKTATLFTGEASKAARPRESRLPYCIVVFDYIMLTLVVLFYMYYIFQFVASRAERAENGFEGNLDPEFEAITEQEYIIEWLKGALGGLLVSYLIAEPVIALLRYILVPYIIHKCSKKKELPEEIEIDLEKKAELEQFHDKKKDDNIRDSNLHLGIDLIADLVENLF